MSDLPRHCKDTPEYTKGHPKGVSAGGQVDDNSGQAAGAERVKERVSDARHLGPVLAKDDEALQDK